MTFNTENYVIFSSNFAESDGFYPTFIRQRVGNRPFVKTLINEFNETLALPISSRFHQNSFGEYIKHNTAAVEPSNFINNLIYSKKLLRYTLKQSNSVALLTKDNK